MEEIRVWSLSTPGGQKPVVAPVESVAETTTEHLLEEALTGHPDLLRHYLRLIGRQNETSGGPLDLLGMDEDGRLVVFELKRGQLTRDAVAQAIDYASFLADLESDELCRHIETNAGKGGTSPSGIRTSTKGRLQTSVPRELFSLASALTSARRGWSPSSPNPIWIFH